jgi:dUTP pyrophosphatase
LLDIKIINTSNNPTPKYSTIQSAGVDLRANIQEAISLNPGERKLIPTGLHLELPNGYEAQVRPRSGLALKHGISVLNSPGTIDADYRGDVGVILVNMGQEVFTVNHGDRIAQLVIAQYTQVNFLETTTLTDSERGADGFGSSGTK